jgi:glycerophosphoryl diester phosphodiesterase
VLAERRATERAALLVSCFHLPSLARVRAADPDLTTGWLVIGPGIGPSGERFATVGGDRREVLAATVSAAAAGGHRALHPHHAFVTPELVSAAHAAGLAVNAWTVDEVDRIRWLADRGVDAVITNVPAVARRALGRARSPD